MTTLELSTTAHSQFIDITAQLQALVTRSGVKSGLCHLFVPHTTAAIVVNEHDDPAVTADIGNYLDKLVPENHGYQHAEGNAPAHIKASLLGNSLSLMIEGGQLVLGTWQGVFFCEFDGPRQRRVLVKIGVG